MDKIIDKYIRQTEVLIARIKQLKGIIETDGNYIAYQERTIRLAYERIEELEKRLAKQHRQLIDYKPRPPAGPNWVEYYACGWSWEVCLN